MVTIFTCDDSFHPTPLWSCVKHYFGRGWPFLGEGFIHIQF